MKSISNAEWIPFDAVFPSAQPPGASKASIIKAKTSLFIANSWLDFFGHWRDNQHNYLYLSDDPRKIMPKSFGFSAPESPAGQNLAALASQIERVATGPGISENSFSRKATKKAFLKSPARKTPACPDAGAAWTNTRPQVQLGAGGWRIQSRQAARGLACGRSAAGRAGVSGRRERHPLSLPLPS